MPQSRGPLCRLDRDDADHLLGRVLGKRPRRGSGWSRSGGRADESLDRPACLASDPVADGQGRENGGQAGFDRRPARTPIGDNMYESHAPPGANSVTFTARWRGIFGAIWPVFLVRSRSSRQWIGWGLLARDGNDPVGTGCHRTIIAGRPSRPEAKFPMLQVHATAADPLCARKTPGGRCREQRGRKTPYLVLLATNRSPAASVRSFRARLLSVRLGSPSGSR